MTSVEDRRHLRHIQQAARSIERSALAGGRDAWMANPELRDATHYRLQTMCESTQRLSEDVKARHPEIPWRAIAGMRNRLVHSYHAVDPAIVWSVVEHDVQPLGRMARRELARTPERQASPGQAGVELGR